MSWYKCMICTKNFGYRMAEKMTSSRANVGRSWPWGEKKAWFPPQHVFCKIFWLKCRTVAIFLPTQRTRSSGPPRYPEHCRKAYRKVSRWIWHPKTWLSFFASYKTSKNMNFIFCKLKKPQNTWISFFCKLK